MDLSWVGCWFSSWWGSLRLNNFATNRIEKAGSAPEWGLVLLATQLLYKMNIDKKGSAPEWELDSLLYNFYTSNIEKADSTPAWKLVSLLHSFSTKFT